MNSKFKFYFDILVGIAGLIGLVLVFVAEDKNKAIIALVAFCLFLLWFIFKVWKTVNTIAGQRHPFGYAKIASIRRYTCLDGKFVEFENIQIVQCKKPILLGIDHIFKWSGTKMPAVTCPGYTVSDIRAEKDGEYDRVHLSFPAPMLYDEVAVVPIHFAIDDSDQKSKTEIGVKVRESMQFISFRVELGNQVDRTGKPARMLRLKYGTDMVGEWKLIENVKFDPITHCYEKQIQYPETGYYYQMEWDR